MIQPIQVAAAVIRENGRILVSTRPEGKKHAGKWEFPGGKLEPGETPAQCIVRELREELDLPVMPLDTIFDFYYAYSPDFYVRLHFLRCIRLDRIEPKSREGQLFCWYPVSDLEQLDFLAADRSAVRFFAGAYRRISQY